MPNLNTSDCVKSRVAHLLERLIAYANHELDGEGNLIQVSVRWLDQQSSMPKLVVQATLKDLANLLLLDPSEANVIEQIRQDLRVCKEILHILDDNRAKTQGASGWHFTFKLWHSSTAKNLAELERHWRQCKPRKPKSSPNAELESPQPHAPLALETSALELEPPQLQQNLPHRSCTQFIGRNAQLTQLLTLLHQDHPAARVEITGIGGVGKTSLIVEVAYRCMAAADKTGEAAAIKLPRFEAIIFTSAKPQHLTPQGVVLPHLQPERTLRQICRSILQTLDDTGWLEKDLADQINRIRANFRRQPVLLILDNLETLEEEQDVLAFLYDLPATVKVVVTSCKRAILDLAVHLEALSEAEGIPFVQAQAQIKAVDLSLEEAHCLYQATGGIPAAIVYAVGQLSQGYLLPDALPLLTLAEGDYCRFYFEHSVKSLVGQPAYPLLMGLALFPKPTSRATLTQIILPETSIAEGLAQLHCLSLVTRQASRYTMMSLTQKYALAELQKDPQCEQSIRSAWVLWCLKFCQQHGNQNWKEWHDYTTIDAEWENIQAVMEWCIEQDKYEDFCQLWQYVKGYTYLYGYQSDRLIWIDWWMQAAQRRSDPVMLAQALRDRAWTLTLMGKPEYLAEAEQLLQQSWDLTDATHQQFQLDLSLEQLMLSLRQGQFESAQHWLQQSRQLLPKVQVAAAEQFRYRVRVDYYEAEIWCRQGQQERAKVLYHQVLQAAESIGWTQGIIYALNWLVEIALDEGALDQAEAWLSQSLPIARQQQDKRSIAIHTRSQALLAHLRGNNRVAQQLAQTALSAFKNLGMDVAAREMESQLSAYC